VATDRHTPCLLDIDQKLIKSFNIRPE